MEKKPRSGSARRPLFGARFLWLLFSTVSLCRASPADTAGRHPHFALVLSGGGARGLSQIGVLKALDEADLRPDLIIGTSMGAIIGSLYAAGLTPDSIRTIARRADWDLFFSNTAARTNLFVSQKTEPVNFLFELRLSDRLEPVPPSSISYGQAFYDLLSPILAPAVFNADMRFDNLSIPLRIVATDILTGRKIVIDHGNLATAVRASCSVPLAFSPVAKDSLMLMDGGLAANIPVETAHELNASTIVAVDVTSPLWGRSELDNPVHLMDQVVAISVKRQKEIEKKHADCIIAPELAEFSNTDFRRIDTLIDRGYRSARDHLDELKRLLSHLHDNGSPDPRIPRVSWINTEPRLAALLDSMLRSGLRDSASGTAGGLRPLLRRSMDRLGFPFGRVRIIAQDVDSATVSADAGSIRAVEISGNSKTSSGMIRTAADLRPGQFLSPPLLQQAQASLYATGLFKNVNIDMDSSRTVRIMLDEKKYWRVRMGLRYDEFHLGEGFIEPAYENLFGRGLLALLHLQYGLRRENYAIEISSNNFLTANFANTALLEAYLSHERIVTDTIVISNSIVDTTTMPDTSLWHRDKSMHKSGVLAMLGVQIGRIAMLSGGLHLEFYKVQSANSSIFRDVMGQKFLPYALLRFTVDDLDRLPFPTSGEKLHVTLSGTNRGIGGNSEFIRFDGSAFAAVTLENKNIFSGKVRFAWASSPLPEVEHFFVGGAFSEETHRDMDVSNYVPFYGILPRMLSGDIMAIGHAGYQYHWKKNWYLTLDANWGYVWQYKNFAWNDMSDDLLERAPVGIGLGVSVETIAGPVRLNYGRLLHDFAQSGIEAGNLFYFSLGHDF